MELGAVYGIIKADVYVVGVGTEVRALGLGDGGIWGRRTARGCGNNDITVLFRLVARLLGKLARHDIVGTSVGGEQIHRHACELQRLTAAKEEYFIACRDVHKLAECRLSTLEDLSEFSRAIAYLGNRHTRAVIVQHLSLRPLKHLKR